MKLIKPLAISAILLMSSSAWAEIAVIVNPANANTVTVSDINRAFLGKLKKFADGQAIVAVNSASGNAVRVEFQQKALKKSAAQIKAYWSKRLFSGKGKPLQELSSDADVISFVASTPNAIGYIDAAKADNSVKVVQTF